MWFRNVFLKTLRDFRIAIFGWGLGTGLLVYVVLASFPSLVTTPQARASLVALSQGFAWLAEPVRVDTAGGYATFKYGPIILLIALWALSAAGRVLRGEEDHGSLDVLLSLPEGRVRIAVEKVAAIWTALGGMGLLAALLVVVGGQQFKGGFTVGDALLFSLNLALSAAVFAGIALLLSQFTRERGTATGLTGILLLVFIVLDMVHRVIPEAGWISRLSPVYYYNLNKPLVPGFGVNVGALVVLAALALILSAAGVWLFARRDVGGVIPLPQWLQPRRGDATAAKLPGNEWDLRSVYTRSLGMIRRPTIWWTLAIAGFAAWIVVVVRQTESQLATIYQSSPVLKDLVFNLGGSNSATNATILSAMFAFLPVALMAFAVTQANRWAADEEDGRLELLLAAPRSRLEVLLARFSALGTSTIIIGVATLLTTVLASAASGIKLDSGNVAAASLEMIPLGLLVAALGYLFAGWLRTAFDTGLLSFLLVFWFFASFLGPELKWPEATLRLSPFYYYGSPLLHGFGADILGIVAVSLLALGVGAWRFAHKDIGV